MGTPFSAVFDQFFMLIKDYRLVNLYNASTIDFETYLTGWLIPAIGDFYNCDQSLTYTTIEFEDALEFEETLSDRNVVMLAKLLTKYWLEKEINDILQMNQHVIDRDFKVYSESANMAEKRKKYSELREELSQDLVDYSLNSRDMWVDWLAGTFYVP